MLALIARRSLEAGFAVLAVTFLAFVLTRYVGDPVQQMVGQDTPIAEREALRDRLGLNDPLPDQFARFLGRAATGDLGYSLRTGRPVAELLGERLPASLELTIVAALIVTLLALPGGIAAATWPQHWLVRLMSGASLAGLALPTFLTGALLILIFSVWLPWLPAFGRGDTVVVLGWPTGLLTTEGRAALVLPALTLALFPAALFLRLVRGEMIAALGADYVRAARSRGLGPVSVHLRHALPNALGPLTAIAGLQLGALLAFAVITEAVFQWPGLGLLLLQSIQVADVAVLAAYLPLTAIVFLAINLVADLMLAVIDPRVRIT
jgi:peptide/nickel transport system permease protein